MVIKITQETKHGSRIIEARDRRKVKAMEGKGHGEKGRIERIRKAEVGVNLVRDKFVY